jgi:hypothetical protein
MSKIHAKVMRSGERGNVFTKFESFIQKRRRLQDFSFFIESRSEELFSVGCVDIIKKIVW